MSIDFKLIPHFLSNNSNRSLMINLSVYEKLSNADLYLDFSARELNF